ncbi:hypothetical protein [Leisingera sp. McT4-56]|uniref:hypothetical protein n=1 Tax=Leisingera sp. McT4-56 TaxID=2881255 RepID=UPI001CF87146|nr:hypothetical protein [Leisingera sp. McT4-56]MCB4457682.1 hypothetical protein [Leisingera sp. McT4-56]
MRGAILVTACAALTACATPGADTILSLSESVQKDSLRSCHADLGIKGPFAPQKLLLRDGRVSVFAANGNGVSLNEARSINKCSRERLLGQYGAGRDVFLHSAETQNANILACKNELGVPGQFEVQVFSYGSRATEVTIVPGGSVTKQDARAINACARGKLRRGATAAPAQPYQAGGLEQAAPQAAYTTVPRLQCPKDASVLYGGSTYCVGS